MNSPSKLRVPEHVHWRRFASELVLLDLQSGEYYGLNDVGAELFERLARGEEFPHIVKALLDVFDVDRSTLEADIERMIADLVKRGLLT